MLKKGFTPGKWLGRKRQGITSPISLQFVWGKEGLGFVGDASFGEDPPVLTWSLYEHFVKEDTLKNRKLKGVLEVQTDEEMLSEDETDIEDEIIPSTVVLEEIKSPCDKPSKVQECLAIEDSYPHPYQNQAMSGNEDGRGTSTSTD